MVAAMTPLPVVGVPIKTSTFSGLDSLYSIVQMPRGIPVATVAVGNAENAGLLAVRMVAATRPGLQRKMVEYQEGLQGVVEGKSEKLQAKGVDGYLEGMANKSGTVNV
jgi:phosphoribosylaminoimidazole carboxylase PurE protein